MFAIHVHTPNTLVWDIQINANHAPHEQRIFVTPTDCNAYLVDSLNSYLHYQVRFFLQMCEKNDAHKNFDAIPFAAHQKLCKMYQWMRTGHELPAAADVAKYLLLCKHHFNELARHHHMINHIECKNYIIEAAEKIKSLTA
jgi:hypothetical protein